MRRLAARMLELDVKSKLEIYDHEHLDIALGLLAEGLLMAPLQFSIVLGVYGGAAATPANLVALVDRLPASVAWQVIGIGRSNLAMTAIGLALGGNARTGMEDTLMLRRGVPGTGNAPLVKRLAAVARAIEREPATTAEPGTRSGSQKPTIRDGGSAPVPRNTAAQTEPGLSDGAPSPAAELAAGSAASPTPRP